MSPTPGPAPASTTRTSTPRRVTLPTLDQTPRPSPDRPPSLLPPPAAGGPDPEAMTQSDRSGWAGFPGVGSLFGNRATPETGEPPTSSSDGDDRDDRPARKSTRVDAALVAATLGSLLVVLAGLGGWLAARTSRELRPPTEHERDQVAEPVAAILCRHFGANLHPDLVDGVRAAAGVTSYIQTAPLTRVAPEIDLDPDLPPGYEEP